MGNLISLNPCFNGRYSRRQRTGKSKSKGGTVLILVLMEDTLGVLLKFSYVPKADVLILVLMEDTLGACS